MVDTVVLGISYNGQGYHGWQSQPDGQTVQDVLETALKEFTQHEVGVFCAGRTDTGVHALEQVVHLKSPVVRPQESWVRGLNALLPLDIRILWTQILPPEVGDKSQYPFHARFSAVSRSYLYVLRNSAVNSALNFTNIGWDFHPLNISAMQKAAGFFVGTHDFSSFRSSQCQAKSPIKNLYTLEIIKQGDLIFFFLKANAFLHHMVRNMVGALLYVGKGKYSPEDMLELLEHKNRKFAPPTFMANGLYLMSVEYPEHYVFESKAVSPNTITEAVSLWRNA